MPPQNVHLHFDRNQRLHRAVVQFARKTGALSRSRTPAQPVEKVNVVHCWPNLMHQVQQEAEFLLLLSPPRWIKKVYPAPPLAPKEKGNGNERIKGLDFP